MTREPCHGCASASPAVCGPAGEQSAQSASIPLEAALRCFPIHTPGALEGPLADSVMLALNSPVFQVRLGPSIVLRALPRRIDWTPSDGGQ